MVVFTNAFLLAAASTATPLSHARIGYQNWLRDLEPADVTVSTETDDGPADAPLRSNTYEYWEPTAMPATWEVDMGEAREIGYVGVVGLIASRGVSVLVETSENGADWTTFALEILAASDNPLMFLDDEVSARYLRLTFSGSEVPRVAAIAAGPVLAMPRTIYGGHAPITMSRQTVRETAVSRGGQFLGVSFRRHGVATDASFRYLAPDFVRDDFDPFIRAAREHPYFFAWRPEDYPEEVGYVWTEDDIRPSNMGVREFMEVSWQMQGWGHE